MKALFRSDKPTAAMAASALTHVAVIAVLLWRVGPSTPSAAKVVAEIAMAAPALEQVAATPVETVTAATPPDVRPQETKIVEAEPSRIDEVPSIEPLPEMIETKAPDPVVAAPPPKPRPSRTAAAPQPRPAPPEIVPEQHPATPVQESSGAPAAVQTASAAHAVAAGPPPDYLTNLRAWIERHKQYPRAAQLRRQQGTALLKFTMTRDGRVLAHHVERSSGHATLDREVEELIERAAPLPAMPADMTQDRLEVVVPVEFALR